MPLNNSTLDETNVGNQYLSPNVVMQLHEYISAIALLYPENAFHSFEHVSHVALSTQKFLQRIIDEGTKGNETYGLVSDPLVIFAIVYSALIHE